MGDGKNEDDVYVYFHCYSSDALMLMKILNSYDKAIIGFSHLLTKVISEFMEAFNKNIEINNKCTLIII